MLAHAAREISIKKGIYIKYFYKIKNLSYCINIVCLFVVLCTCKILLYLHITYITFFLLKKYTYFINLYKSNEELSECRNRKQVSLKFSGVNFGKGTHCLKQINKYL